VSTDAMMSSDATLTDAATDAGDAGAKADAGDAGKMNCNPINIGGSAAGSCVSLQLTGNTFTVGAAPTTTIGADGAIIEIEAEAPVVATSEDGAILEDGGVTLGGGGISEINPKYKGGELDSNSATSLTLTGLTNGLNYVVGVSTIDGSGNVGPISVPLACAIPAPVNDYWKTYEKDGGSARGCALESGGANADLSIFALGVVGAAVAFVRRRRR
jgi:MYXO-CTERM domain-containing protein